MASLDLLNDNPTSLIGRKCDDLIIFGLSIGMAYDNVISTVKEDKRICYKGPNEEAESYNNISIYCTETEKHIIDCIWDKRNEKMSCIIVLSDCKKFLTKNFKRLLSSDAIAHDSYFSSKFLLEQTRNPYLLDLGFKGRKNIIHYFDHIGISIIQRVYSKKVNYFFTIGIKEL